MSTGYSEPGKAPFVPPPRSLHQPCEVGVLISPLYGQEQRTHVYGDHGLQVWNGFLQPPNVPHGVYFSLD